MTNTADHSPAERLRAQIARMVAGNGVSPNATVVQSEEITSVRMLGELDIRMHVKTENSHGKGAVPARWRQTYKDFSELSSSISEWQTKTLNDEKKLQYAADQILMETNHGWGLSGKDLPMSHLDFDVGAAEQCKTCNGGKKTTCRTCDGRKQQPCEQCRGRREIQCQTCYGRMTLDGGEDCQTCKKTGQVTCPACQGKGEITCRACAGKGEVGCAACDAQGQTWRQMTFRVFAQTNFKMQLGGEYDEKVLEHIRRMRPEHLLDGRANITAGEKTPGDGAAHLSYVAEFPIVHLELKVGDIPCRFVMLGEKHTVVEATHFMDQLLKPSLGLLQRARAGQIAAQAALAQLAKIRFFRDAMTPGHQSQDLRHKYPIGISANIIKETPASLQHLLSTLTQQPRMFAAIGFNVVLGLLMFYTAKTHPGIGGFQFDDIIMLIFALLMNAGVMVIAHFGVTYQTIKSFGIEPNLTNIHVSTAIGKIGLISIGVSFALCALEWILR